MAEKSFTIRVSRRGLTGNLSLNELIIFALFNAISGLTLAGPLLTFAEQNPGQHLLNLSIYSLLCVVPFAFSLAVNLSLLHVTAAAPVHRLASATFKAAAFVSLLLAAILFLLFFASAEAPAGLGRRPQRPLPDGGGGGGGFPWFKEEF